MAAPMSDPDDDRRAMTESVVADETEMWLADINRFTGMYQRQLAETAAEWCGHDGYWLAIDALRRRLYHLRAAGRNGIPPRDPSPLSDPCYPPTN